jgi:hypothetical protein
MTTIGASFVADSTEDSRAFGRHTGIGVSTAFLLRSAMPHAGTIGGDLEAPASGGRTSGGAFRCWLSLPSTGHTSESEPRPLRLCRWSGLPRHRHSSVEQTYHQDSADTNGVTTAIPRY